MWPPAAALIGVAVLLLWLLNATIRSSTSRSSIPVVPGVPLLGSTIALSKGGLAFISQCRQQFGDGFCLRLLGQRMVFVFEPAMLTLFLKAPEDSVSFKPAVKQFTQRIYGLPSSEFFARHEDILATLRQLLVPSQLQALGLQLLTHAQPLLQGWQQQGRVELWSACQSLVFAAAGQVVFGSKFFSRHGLAAVQQAFLDFEGSFEVAASPVPHLLLPKFRRSRKALLSMLASSLAAGDFEGTLVSQLLQGCGLPERLWPNLLLAVLWASQANSMPALFWSLALLLLPEHAEARARVVQELRSTADTIRQQQQPPQQQPAQQQQQQQEGPPRPELDEATVSAMLQLSLEKRSWVSRCVAEAIRLRLHSIAVRFVADKNLILTPSSSSSSSSSQPGGSLHVPRGSILCICPIESHHDPRLYPDQPWAFKPDREAVQGLGPGTVVPGLAGLGFGGGFWRCPDRFFAEMELALLLQLVLLQFPDLQPLATVQENEQQQQRQPHHATSSLLGSLLASVVPSSLQEGAVFGLGLGSGARQQAAQWQGSGCSGSGSVRLPAFDLQRLVGFKVPAHAWHVRVGGQQQQL